MTLDFYPFKIEEVIMRTKRTLLFGIAFMAIVLLSVSAVNATSVSWTDWTDTTNTGVTGALNIGSGSIGVTFSGAYSGAQTSGGTNYWNPSAPYISPSVPNAPPAADIIALDTGGTATITFSQSVHNPLIALVSWNNNTVYFGVPIEILSYGAGYWGSGTPISNLTGTGFFSGVHDEVHGVIRLPGDYTTISFTHTNENWHGFTVGAEGATVPVPGAVWLLASGLAGLAGARRKFRK